MLTTAEKRSEAIAVEVVERNAAIRGRSEAVLSSLHDERTFPTKFRWALRVGVAALAIVGAVVVFEGGHTPSDADPPRSPARSGAIELVGLTAQRVEPVTYEPGASAVWPAGEQIVGVAVQSGSLTVYGPEGERRVYVAGEGYAAGWTAYRTVNETDDPVEALITIHGRP